MVRSGAVPVICAPAIALPAESAVSSANSPAPVPPGAFQVLSLPKVQSDEAVLLRNLVKLSVVPDDSDRCTVWMVVPGSEAPWLSALIAASSHFLIDPEKILAMVAGLSCR